MTPRSLVRRPLQVSGLLLATAALGTAVAPAASAMVDPSAPTDHTPAHAPLAAPRVLTNSPASYLGTPDEPVSFGMGKLQISVAPEPGIDAPESEDLSGAQVVVSFPDDVDEDGVVPTATCTTDTAGTCVFPADSFGIDEASGAITVYPGGHFDVEQVTAPSSGVFTLPADEDAVVHGVGTFDPRVFGPVPFDQPAVLLDDVEQFAPSATPAQSGPGTTVTGSVVFYDPLATVSPGQPGPVVPPAAVAPAADSTAPAAPVVPVTADASAAPAAATAAAPTLASTGADVGPVAAVGGGLLVAGAAGLVLARRRAPR